MDDNKEKDEKEIKNENEIEVVIGDSSDIKFSEVEDFVGGLKPKVEKKSNIIIPGAKKKTENKEEDNKEEDEEE